MIRKWRNREKIPTPKTEYENIHKVQAAQTNNTITTTEVSPLNDT